MLTFLTFIQAKKKEKRKNDSSYLTIYIQKKNICLIWNNNNKKRYVPFHWNSIVEFIYSCFFLPPILNKNGLFFSKEIHSFIHSKEKTLTFFFILFSFSISFLLQVNQQNKFNVVPFFFISRFPHISFVPEKTKYKPFLGLILFSSILITIII